MRSIRTFILLTALIQATWSVAFASESTVNIASGDWVLVGDLSLPESSERAPAVLMLNKAAVNYLKEHARVDTTRIAVVGGSYSGEEMAKAGRIDGYVAVYVALSPGSFSDRCACERPPAFRKSLRT